MDTLENKLMITVEDGSKKVINVLDIIDSYVFNKSYMIYTFEDETNALYASIIDESDNSFSLEPITSQEELNYIDGEIDRVASELEEVAA